MSVHINHHTTALVLQGGGALGAYQAGVYAALHEAGVAPEWVAGISIGAINAAIIAGNAPENRIERLNAFWQKVSSHLILPSAASDGPVRSMFNETAAMFAALSGVPGFFSPRMPPATLQAPGTMAAISYYDTAPLRETLLELVDFERINAGETRLSVGAVNVTSGNFIYFDNRERTIQPEHIMASGALPPGFPPVVIDGEPYWDGGLVSNTPLQYVLDAQPTGGIEIYQVDLFPARGPMPQTLFDVAQREKDIRFSSRTRLNTDMATRMKKLREAAIRLTDKLPAEVLEDPDLRFITDHLNRGSIAIMHLINRAALAQSQSKDYEFSRQTVNEHWAAGHTDTLRSLASPGWKNRSRHPRGGVFTFDLADEPRGHSHGA
ncbi:MAG TPA: patatin-like phospholipase family protein [Novosphingobium sp.]|nr:patatin-like phospholipase family protein [Novosphingobium sp.]